MIGFSLEEAGHCMIQRPSQALQTILFKKLKWFASGFHTLSLYCTQTCDDDDDDDGDHSPTGTKKANSAKCFTILCEGNKLSGHNGGFCAFFRLKLNGYYSEENVCCEKSKIYLLPRWRWVRHSKFPSSFFYSLNTSHTERQSFMYLRTQFQREKNWLSNEPILLFSFFFQWTSARLNANLGRCISGHLSHSMRHRLNVMLNCLSCALGWSLHYMALEGLLKDLGDISDS